MDLLLCELLKKFPIPQIATEQNKPEEDKAPTANKNDAQKDDPKLPVIKQEPPDEPQIKSEPQEKKMKLG